MSFILTEGKISPKVTRARGQAIKSRKAKQLVLHLWRHPAAVSKSSSDSLLAETSASLKPRCSTLFRFVLC